MILGLIFCILNVLEGSVLIGFCLVLCVHDAF
jgi:hypothetical protein